MGKRLINLEVQSFVTTIKEDNEKYIFGAGTGTNNCCTGFSYEITACNCETLNANCVPTIARCATIPVDNCVALQMGSLNPACIKTIQAACFTGNETQAFPCN